MRRRPVVLALAVLTIGGSSAVAAGGAPALAAPVAASGRFTAAATPTRILDTRQSGPVGSGGTVVIDLRGELPPGASAAAVNVTITDATADTYVSAYATGSQRTVTSILNTSAGVTTANTVTVPVGVGSDAGRVTLFLQQGPADLVVDYLGAYAPASSTTPGASWYPTTARRLLDTRSTAPLRAGSAATVTTSFGSPALNQATTAVVVTLLATEPIGDGYLSAWNGDPNVARTTSAVNFAAGITVSNTAVVPVRCTAGCAAVQFAVQNNISASTQVVVDLFGRYGTPGAAGGAVYRSLPAPVRLNSGNPFNVTLNGSVQLPSLASIDPAATSASLNVTTDISWYGPAVFTVWPGNEVPRPAVSSFFLHTTPQAAGLLSPLARDRSFALYYTGDNSSCSREIEGCEIPTFFYVDVQGTFDPDPASA